MKAIPSGAEGDGGTAGEAQAAPPRSGEGEQPTPRAQEQERPRAGPHEGARHGEASVASQLLATALVLPMLAVFGAIEAALAGCASLATRVTAAPTTPLRVSQAQHVAPLVEAVQRAIRHRARRDSDKDSSMFGAPRGWQAAPCLHTVGGGEVEPVAASLWCSQPVPRLPPAVARRGSPRGGRLAIVRDVSASMDGDRSRWASAVAASTIAMSRSRALQARAAPALYR